MTTSNDLNPLEALDIAHLNAQIAELIPAAGKLQAKQFRFHAEEGQLRRGWRFYPVVAIAAFGGAMAAVDGALVGAGKLFVGN